ncbi:MAG TPA: hypothetical protein VK763_20590 [Terriglobales bacterium]|nr:hypothetical protein [Terriglobales bacterium]
MRLVPELVGRQDQVIRQDQVMKRAGRSVWMFVGLASLLLPACSRQPVSVPPKENTQSVPFGNSPQSDGISPTQAFASAFTPAGTAIVIQLQASLSSAESHSGDQFQAILDEPIVVQGQTLAPRGTAITGRVLAAKASEKHSPGFLRLTLSSMLLNGKSLDVHTSSLFYKGGLREYSKSGSRRVNDVQFSTGRRLSFRLIQALSLQG